MHAINNSTLRLITSWATIRKFSFIALGSTELGWQSQLLPFPNPCDVQIKEVAVENSLNTSSYNSNQVKESLKVVAVDPVEDVQTTVAAQCKQIVAGNSLSLSSLAYHEQLRQDCNRLQVNRKGPKNL